MFSTGIVIRGSGIISSNYVVNVKQANKLVKHFKTLRNYSSSSSSSSNGNIILSHTIYDPPQKESPSGSPFLITHGLLGSKGNWNSIAKAVSKTTNRKVITFDSRNHGDSPHNDTHNYDIMADDIANLAKSLNLSKFTIMGHSMGGRTVMDFALRYPEQVDRLVVVDVSPISIHSSFHEMRDYLKALMNINFDLGRKITLSEARKIANEALKSVVPEPAVRAFLLTNLAEKDGTIYWKPNLPILVDSVSGIGTFPQELLTKDSQVPTLFIRGEKSTYIPDKDVPGLKKIFPNCKVDTIKNSGHWPHADNVNDFLASLIPFLLS